MVCICPVPLSPFPKSSELQGPKPRVTQTRDSVPDTSLPRSFPWAGSGAPRRLPGLTEWSPYWSQVTEALQTPCSRPTAPGIHSEPGVLGKEGPLLGVGEETLQDGAHEARLPLPGGPR